MTLQLFANLFNLTGFGLILLVSLFVQQNAPSPFFRAWVKAYSFGFLMLAFDSVSQHVGRPAILSLLEIGSAYANAWFLLETGWLLQSKSPERRLIGWVILPLMAIGALMLGLGQAYTHAFILPGLALASSFVWLGSVLLRDVHPRPPQIQWLAIPVIVTGLLPVLYPLIAGTSIEWVSYWLGGVLNLLTGMGMVIFLQQETAGQLRLQNEKLVQLDQLKRNFISTVSHELRTPLTSVIGYLEFLEDRIGGPLTVQQSEFVNYMKEGSSQLAELIDALLDSHQIEAGAFEVKHEEVDLVQTLDRIANTLRSLLDKKAIRLEIALEPERPVVWADARRVIQVLNNLIGNALKFTEPGGVIRLESHLEGDRLRLAIIDSGIGIPASQLAHIFEPFFQVDSGLVRQHSGSGLGLSIVRSMVQAMGGQVGVESHEGKGSVFWFTLPVATPALVDAQAGSAVRTTV